MIEITIDVRDARWRQSLRSYRSVVRTACLTALAHKKIKRAELAVVLASNHFIKNLNHSYRGKNKPTNVLSFEGEGKALGDIVLALETIKREAADQRKTMKQHTTHLVVHGVLHLLGYNHEDEAEAEDMEATEVKILEKLGVRNPYLS